MPKHGKIKSKVVQSTINNKDVLDMFHGVLGTGEGTDLNLSFVYPKYLKIVEHCTRYMLLLETLRDTALMGKFPTEAGHLGGYVAALREQATVIFSAPDLKTLHPPSQIEQLSGGLIDYRAVTAEEYDAFAAVYKGIKGSNLVNTIVVTCNNLVPHKKSLEDAAALKDRFLMRTAGLTFAPLPGLPAMNFKQIYISDLISPVDKELVLMVLHKMFTVSHDVYETMSSPDIDVNEFVQVIIGSLDDVKKQIPRCDEAFDKIRDSVSLLKGNFGGYYKDFVASNNPTIIMENFVLDVSKSTKSSPSVTAQFRRIISHYRKLASQQAQHPQMQSLFAQVDKNFQELEKRSHKADAEEDGASADEAVADESDGGSAEAVADESDGGSAGAVADESDGGSAEAAEAVAAEQTPEERATARKREKRERQRRKKVEQQLENAMQAAADDGVGLGEELAGRTPDETPAAPAGTPEGDAAPSSAPGAE